MKTIWVSALLLMLAGSAVAESEVINHDVTGLANQEFRAGWFGSMKSDCTAEMPPQARVAERAKNGAIRLIQTNVRTNSVPECPNAELSAVVVFYQSKENFRGMDSFTLELKNATGKTSLHRFNITVPGLVQ
ncbi:hypothetical protein [Bradyrhizobium liaoningense]|uniref:hypothetical protein n=1 Tax=Bradyrhizobium liaoningense TaxID=43992 RepID=UPI001BAC84EF|nr:hypothetical protein [Bradyrhizobium liaoningense]MBR0904581.1 hypothetical protein [Bradyrhizobium liaoningense]